MLLTNPEMLHLALLAHHEKWAAFFAGLTHVVVDEVHTYRGVMGSHMAQVFRRLSRVCRRYGSAPSFAFLSATVGNPGELARQLSGREVTEVTESGAPRGGRHFLFLNPALTMADSPAQVAILLLKAALARGLRTIVYTQSRRLTELIALWAAERAGQYRGRISAYRAGFLPEERRDIEARMASGELLAVISTSALELGIDIGSLDLCILVGYPGTVMQTLQRGGRVGRAQQESAVALIAGEDQLDQYFMRNPRDFFARPPERAVLNPANPRIVERHLVCAAAEMPLVPGEPWLAEPGGGAPVLDAMLADGRLLASSDGAEITPRAAARTITWTCAAPEAQLRIIAVGRRRGRAQRGPGGRAPGCKETHPGAVYLHLGQTYVVQELDLPGRTVTVAPARVDHHTRVARGQIHAHPVRGRVAHGVGHARVPGPPARHRAHHGLRAAQEQGRRPADRRAPGPAAHELSRPRACGWKSRARPSTAPRTVSCTSWAASTPWNTRPSASCRCWS